MYVISAGYALDLTFSTLEDAERALEVLIEGGVTDIKIKVKPIEEVTK